MDQLKPGEYVVLGPAPKPHPNSVAWWREYILWLLAWNICNRQVKQFKILPGNVTEDYQSSSQSTEGTTEWLKRGKKTWSWFKFCGMTWWGFFSQNTPEILKWNRCGWGGVLLNSFASLYTSYSYRHPFPPAHTVIAQFISMQTPYSQAVFAIVT